MNCRQFDVLVIIALPIIAVILTLTQKPSFFISILLFLGVPTGYLAIKDMAILKKVFAFSLIFSIPVWISADMLAAVNHAWEIPKTIFPFRLFGAITIENFTFCLFWVLCALLFYKHFFDPRDKDNRFPEAIRYFVIIFFAIAAIVL